MRTAGTGGSVGRRLRGMTLSLAVLLTLLVLPHPVAEQSDAVSEHLPTENFARV